MSALIEDDLWDYYSGLPNPKWYHNNQKEDEEEITSDSNDIEVITE